MHLKAQGAYHHQINAHDHLSLVLWSPVKVKADDGMVKNLVTDTYCCSDWWKTNNQINISKDIN